MVAAVLFLLASAAWAQTAPSITSISPTVGPPSPVGASVTLHGAAFGLSQGTSTVTFGGISATPSSWNDTTIVVSVPSGLAAGNADITVAVNGSSSNAQSFLVIPVITGVSPGSAPVGASVTINGAGFGTTTSAVTFNGTTATPTNWAGGSITVPVPTGASTGNLIVTVNSIATNQVSFTVLPPPPSITSISPTVGPPSPVGSSLTIRGANFGSPQGASSVTIGGITGNPSSWSNTTIVVPVPSSLPPGSADVVVRITGNTSNSKSFFAIPVITGISPNPAPIGVPVTISGAGFGTVASAITFNGTSGIPSSWNGTSIVAPVPTGATTGSVVATINGFATNGATLTVSTPPPPPPSITSVSPTSGSGGTIVNINGSHFGDTQGTSLVRIGGAGGTADVSTWSDTAITVTVPNTATSGPLLVIVNNQVSNGVDFTAPPVIRNLLPSSGVAGTLMTIDGTNFGGTQGSSTISVDGTPATASAWTATSIQVPVPSGAATGDVLVTVNAVSSNPSTFVFNPTNGIVTSFRYDPKGQLISTTDPLNHTTAFTYTTGSGAPLGLLETATDSLNNVTRFQYDAAGNRSSMTDPLLNTTLFVYDSMNRPTKVTFANGSTNAFTYDLRGRQTDRTDGNLKTTHLTYDDADRVTTITDANQGVTQYSYDTENNLTSITDAQQRQTAFSYDNQRHRVQTTFPSGLSETYVYDPAGNLTSKTDRNNNTIRYSYDSINRMTQKSFPDGTAVALNYDALNRLTQVADTTTTLGVSYDTVGHPSASTTQYSFLPGQVFTTSTSYDDASHTTRFTAPDGTTTDYSYDELGRLASLNSSLAGPFAFSYDALDRRTLLTRPNGVTTEYSYDPLSHLLSVLHKTGATILDGATYTLDSSGIRASKTNHLNNINEQYAYDQNDQLVQVSQGTTIPERYTYDAVGNRLSSATSASYAYNSSNELTSTSNASYSYDHNGNMVSKADSSGTTVYNWDVENRLTSIVLPAGSTITFKYDPFGRRIQKNGPSGSIIYLYNQAGIIEELDQTGSPLARYVRGTDDDELLAETRLGVTVYYEQDGLGSVTSLSTSAATLVNTYAYDSFGRLNATAGSVINPFQYTARDFDSETGLQYYRARYYDPSIGRFINEDPIGLEGGINAYAYVHNRPTDLNDPFGLRDVFVAIWNAQGLMSSDPSVGHAAIIETDGQIIVSQFPDHHAAHGRNLTLSWEDTLGREGRNPDEVFKVFVPDDAAFDKVAHERRLRDDWIWKPNSPKETNCVEAADSALLAGGLPLDRYYLWPGYLGDDLQKLSEKKKQGPWKVSPAKVKDIPIVPNADAFPPIYYYPPVY